MQQWGDLDSNPIEDIKIHKHIIEDRYERERGRGMDNGLVRYDDETVVGVLDQLAEDIYKWAGRKGWNDQPVEFGTRCALIHSEVSEALEAYRQYHDFIAHTEPDTKHPTGRKPTGVPSEFADAMIRILHYCRVYRISPGLAVIDKMKFNEDRPWRHGGKAL